MSDRDQDQVSGGMSSDKGTSEAGGGGEPNQSVNPSAARVNDQGDGGMTGSSYGGEFDKAAGYSAPGSGPSASSSPAVKTPTEVWPTDEQVEHAKQWVTEQIADDLLAKGALRATGLSGGVLGEIVSGVLGMETDDPRGLQYRDPPSDAGAHGAPDATLGGGTDGAKTVDPPMSVDPAMSHDPGVSIDPGVHVDFSLLDPGTSPDAGISDDPGLSEDPEMSAQDPGLSDDPEMSAQDPGLSEDPEMSAQDPGLSEDPGLSDDPEMSAQDPGLSDDPEMSVQDPGLSEDPDIGDSAFDDMIDDT